MSSAETPLRHFSTSAEVSVRHFGTSAEVSIRHFGTSAEVSGHFGHAEVSWVRTSEGPKCLGSEVSWVRSVCTPISPGAVKW